MITGGRGPDVPHSPERGGPSQTKKRSLGDVSTLTVEPDGGRRPNATWKPTELFAVLHQAAGILALRPVNFGGVGRGAPLVFWGSVAAWTGRHCEVRHGAGEGTNLSLERASPSNVRAWILGGIGNTKRPLRANNSTVWVWFLPREVPAPLLSMALLGSTPNGGYLYDR